MSKRSRKNSFIVQGSILAVASIMVRLIGIIYRIPMTSIIGDNGNAYYSSAFSIYNILLLLSSYSLPVAVSKMVSARLANKEYRNIQRILHGALAFAFVVGTIFGSLTYFGAEFMADKIVNLPLAAIPLKTMAPTVFIMAFLGVFRGYYQGMNTTVPTAISQILEQIVNAIVSVCMAYVLSHFVGNNVDIVKGSQDYASAWGATGGTIGTGAGAAVALLFCLLIYSAYKKTIRKNLRRDRHSNIDSYQSIGKTLLVTVIPVILSTAIYNLIDIVDNSMFSYAMINASDTYTTLWGVYSGKYLLLVHVPVAFASAMAASSVPAITRAMVQENYGLLVERVTAALKLTMIVAIPSAVGLTVLASPIIKLLFRSDNSQAHMYLTVGAIAVVFFSLSTVTNAILQGLGKMNIPVRNALISLAFHVAILAGVLWKLNMGIYGVILSYIFFGMFMGTLNLFSIGKYLNLQYSILKVYVLPSIAAILMGAAAYGVYHRIYQVMASNVVSTLVAVFVAIIVYGFLILLFRCMDEVELYDLPMGGRIVTLAKKLHLLP